MNSSYVPALLRRQVVERADGRCEYCGISESVAFAPHEIDHIIARKHGGETEAENLALSCILCNKYKGSDIASVDPGTEQIVPLYHPRQERWIDHFELHESHIMPLTPTGRATVRLLQLNQPDRVEERRLLIEIGMFSAP